MASVRQLVKPNREGKRPWVVEYTDADGKRRRSTPKSGLKRDAEKLRIKIEADVEQGVHVPDSQTVTVAEAVDLWFARCEARVSNRDRLRKRTLKNWKNYAYNHLVAGLGTRLINKVTARDVQNWVEELGYRKENPLQFESIRSIVAITRMVFTDAAQRGFLVRNVIQGTTIRVPGRAAPPVAIPDKPTIGKLIAEVQQRTRTAKWLRPILHIAIFAGLRRGEIRALTWEKVDLDGGMILVRAGMDCWGGVDEPKTRAGIRDVPMPGNLLAEMKRWHLFCGRPAKGLVFTSGDGKFIHDVTLSMAWRRLQWHVLGGEKKGKIPPSNFNFHALRHVYASLLIESGLPPKRVQYLMGHASINMTFDHYGKLFENPDLVREAMARVGSSFGA